MSVMWNLWHGCYKISAGCKNCYVYRGDEKLGRDASVVEKTKSYDLPIQKNIKGEYKIKSGELVYTCFTSDFLLDVADGWRAEAFKMIKERSDLTFLFITKRIDRLWHCLPEDWGDGYDNVHIGCTVENTELAKFRLPIFLDLPIKHKTIICEPILEELDLTEFLNEDIKQVVVGGESGINARICDYDWVKKIHDQCQEKNIKFWFKQTGAYFKKDGKIYKVPRKSQHSQAQKAKLDLE